MALSIWTATKRYAIVNQLRSVQRKRKLRSSMRSDAAHPRVQRRRDHPTQYPRQTGGIDQDRTSRARRYQPKPGVRGRDRGSRRDRQGDTPFLVRCSSCAQVAPRQARQRFQPSRAATAVSGRARTPAGDFPGDRDNDNRDRFSLGGSACRDRHQIRVNVDLTDSQCRAHPFRTRRTRATSRRAGRSRRRCIVCLPADA